MPRWAVGRSRCIDAFVSEPKRDEGESIPASSSRIAAVWRSTWALRCLVAATVCRGCGVVVVCESVFDGVAA